MWQSIIIHFSSYWLDLEYRGIAILFGVGMITTLFIVSQLYQLFDLYLKITFTISYVLFSVQLLAERNTDGFNY